MSGATFDRTTTVGGSEEHSLTAVAAGNGISFGTLTGAVVHGSLLGLMTVERTSAGLRVHEGRSGFYELEGRSQADLRLLASSIERLLTIWEVRHVVLRASPEDGPFRAKPAVYKIEAALQLTKNVSVELVLAQTVSNWVNRTDVELPELETNGRRLAKCRLGAIETAAYRLHNDQS